MMFAPRFHTVAFALAVVLSIGTVLGTGIRPAEANGDQIDVEVHVIIARNDNTGVPTELAGLQERLTQQFPQYTGFVLDSFQSLTLDLGQTGSVNVPGSQVISVEYLGANDDRYRMRVSLPGGSANVSAPPDGLFFVGGPELPGGTLILAIRPR